MIAMKFAKAFVFAPFLLAGCMPLGDPLEALRDKKPDTETYSSALASEYLAYAESLKQEGHPIRANKFAKKGMEALSEGDVAPTDNSNFAAEKQNLLSILTPDVKEVSPARAARAQIMYDCMADGNAICRESFPQALNDLQPIADALVHGGENRFSAQFLPGSATLGENALAVVDLIAKRVANLGEYQVELTGPLKKNTLNTNRVLAVEQALIAKGVNASRINVHGDAQSKEVVLSTDKGDKNPHSVTIVIETYNAEAKS